VARKSVVGGSKRVDAVYGDVLPARDRIVKANVRPGYRAQWMTKEEAETRRYGDGFRDLEGNEHEIAPWVPVARKDAAIGGQELTDGSGLTSIVTRGPHVLMEIPEDDFKLLEKKHELISEANARRLEKGTYVPVADADPLDDGSEYIRLRQRRAEGSQKGPVFDTRPAVIPLQEDGV